MAKEECCTLSMEQSKAQSLRVVKLKQRMRLVNCLFDQALNHRPGGLLLQKTSLPTRDHLLQMRQAWQRLTLSSRSDRMSWSSTGSHRGPTPTETAIASATTYQTCFSGWLTIRRKHHARAVSQRVMVTLEAAGRRSQIELSSLRFYYVKCQCFSICSASTDTFPGREPAQHPTIAVIASS